MIGMTMIESSTCLLSRSPRSPTTGVSEVSEVSLRVINGVIARLAAEVPWCAGARDLLADRTQHVIPQVLVTNAWPAFIDAAISQLPRDTFIRVIDPRRSHSDRARRVFLDRTLNLPPSTLPLGTASAEDPESGTSLPRLAAMSFADSLPCTERRVCGVAHELTAQGMRTNFPVNCF